MDTKNKPEKMDRMKCHVGCRMGAGNPRSTLTRSLAVLGILVAGLQFSQARPLYSPRAAETFGTLSAAPAAGTPIVKTIRISWSFPIEAQSPDLIFKLYHSTSLAVPVDQWPVLTNIPGTVRSAVIVADKVCEFFALTASNYLGESDFSAK